MGENILQQFLVIILEPNGTEFVGNLQGRVGFADGIQPNGVKPEVEQIRIDHAAERFARLRPDFFGGSVHAAGRQRVCFRFIHWPLLT